MKSIQLKEDEIKLLKKKIFERGFNQIQPKSKYELLRIDDKSIKLILYNSFKLVYNDSEETNTLLQQILIQNENFDYLIGSDETGKGEWYGPLVIVAVAMKSIQVNDFKLIGVQDSKNMKLSTINIVAEKLLDRNDLIFHKLILMPEKYNKLYSQFKNEYKNLNDLLAWGHSVVIKDILKKIDKDNSTVKIIIDKFDQKKTNYRLRDIKNFNIKIIQKTKGESEIPVATASILAKYYFEKKIAYLNNTLNLNLKKANPKEIPKETLAKIAKLHFSNIL